jgi:outer membrane protein assembly factor BamB
MTKRRHGTAFRIAFAVAAACCALPAEGADGLVASPEPDWPQWRGPRRDAVVDEKGLLDAWPEGGPHLVWKVSGLGKGWSSPIIVGETIYITGDVGQDLKVFALGLDGKVRWERTNGRAWTRSFRGSRAACCYRDGKIYNMNGHGRVACLDAATGEEAWTDNVLGRFRAKVPQFGTAECLLVDGDRLIVTPGGGRALVAALDRKTGETLWTGSVAPEEAETAGYSSPILVEMQGRRLIVNSTYLRTFAADAATGEVLWTSRLAYEKNACSTIPVLCGDGRLFITNADVKRESSSMLQVAPSGRAAEKLWTLDLRNLSGSGIFREGSLYISGAGTRKGFFRLDPGTGEARARLPEPNTAAILWAAGGIVALSGDGRVFFLRPTDDGFETRGAFALVGKKKDAWAHPVLFRGRLYLRYHDTFFCYDVKR